LRWACLLALAACTSLEGWQRDRGWKVERFDDETRWSSPGRSLWLEREVEASAWQVRADFAAWCEGTPCVDADGDGLDDDWEAAVIDSLRPAVQLHPDEPMIDDPRSGVVIVGRVTPSDRCAGEIRVYLAFLYDEDPGRCSAGRHHGDVERMAFALTATDDPLVHDVSNIYTTAHEGTVYDRSFEARDLAGSFEATRDKMTGEMRLVVLVSAGKHAMFPPGSSALVYGCEDVAVGCLTDVCSFEVFDPVVIAASNVGEPDVPLPGPAGIDAWSPDDFCGSDPPSPLTAACAPPVREKLLVDPLGCTGPLSTPRFGTARPPFEPIRGR
jgi:hypothetical protein